MKKTITIVFICLNLQCTCQNIQEKNYEIELIKMMQDSDSTFSNCINVQEQAYKLYFSHSLSNRLINIVNQYCKNLNDFTIKRKMAPIHDPFCNQLHHVLQGLLKSSEFSEDKGITRANRIIDSFKISTIDSKIIYSKLLRESLYSLTYQEKENLVQSNITDSALVSVISNYFIYTFPIQDLKRLEFMKYLIKQVKPNNFDLYSNFMNQFLTYIYINPIPKEVFGKYNEFINFELSENNTYYRNDTIKNSRFLDFNKEFKQNLIEMKLQNHSSK